MIRFFYIVGAAVMLASFPFWFVSVIADDGTAGAVGMLTFILGILIGAIGAAMDYRAREYEDHVDEWHLEMARIKAQAQQANERDDADG